MGRKGRPPGLSQSKYYAVLSILRTPISFNHSVQILAGRVSRLTVAKILKDATLRGAVTVTYRGKSAFYDLSQHGHALTNQVVFSIWWRLGRPRLDGDFSLDGLRTDVYATFLLDQYPLTKIKLSREECRELFATYPDYVVAADFRLIDIYRSLSRHITNYEREVEARIRDGRDPMAINKWIVEREIEGWPEDVILHRVSGIVESGLACKRCFGKGRISELVKRDEGCECPSCRWRTERPENFLERGFKQWLADFEGGGTPLKIGRMLIFPPRLKNGLFAPP